MTPEQVQALLQQSLAAEPTPAPVDPRALTRRATRRRTRKVVVASALAVAAVALPVGLVAASGDRAALQPDTFATASPTPSATPTAEPAPIDLGITREPEGPFPSAEFAVTGHWGGKVGEGYQTLYVGGETRGGNAKVVLFAYALDGTRQGSPVIEVPEGATELVLEAETAEGVVLRDTLGVAYLYDPAGRTLTRSDLPRTDPVAETGVPLVPGCNDNAPDPGFWTPNCGDAGYQLDEISYGARTRGRLPLTGTVRIARGADAGDTYAVTAVFDRPAHVRQLGGQWLFGRLVVTYTGGAGPDGSRTDTFDLKELWAYQVSELAGKGVTCRALADGTADCT